MHYFNGGFPVLAYLQYLLYAKFLTLEAVDVAMIPDCKEEFTVAAEVHSVGISSELWGSAHSAMASMYAAVFSFAYLQYAMYDNGSTLLITLIPCLFAAYLVMGFVWLRCRLQKAWKLVGNEESAKLPVKKVEGMVLSDRSLVRGCGDKMAMATRQLDTHRKYYNEGRRPRFYHSYVSQWAMTLFMAVLTYTLYYQAPNLTDPIGPTRLTVGTFLAVLRSLSQLGGGGWAFLGCVTLLLNAAWFFLVGGR